MNKAVSVFLKPIFQVCFIAIVSFLLMFFAHLKLQQNVFADPISKIQEVSGAAINVDVDLNLQNFLTFNLINNEFVAEFNLLFKFDSNKISLKEIESFSFSKGEIIEKSEPVVTQNNGVVSARYDLKVKFSSNLNFKYFPLEDHRIYITLNNKNLDGKKINFVVNKSSFSFSDSLYTPGWKALNSQAQAGVRTISLGSQQELTYPRAVFSVDFMQASLRQFIFIMLPILIAFLIALCAFALSWKQEFSTIVGLSSASLAAIVGYRYVIERISPKVSYYMLSDHLFTLFLLLIFSIFFVDIFFKDCLQEHRYVRGIVVFGFYIILLASWVLLLFFW